MALGELLCEYRGKITSMKVLPFEGVGQGIKYEVTQVADLSGRLNGHGIGSNYVHQAADGTSTTKFYGVFTTNEGETLLVESGGMSVPLSPWRVRFRTTVTFKATAPRLSWLNMTIVAFEGEGDFATMEVVGKLYEW